MTRLSELKGMRRTVLTRGHAAAEVAERCKKRAKELDAEIKAVEAEMRKELEAD